MDVRQRPGRGVRPVAGGRLRAARGGAYRLAHAAADADAVPVRRRVVACAGHVLTQRPAAPARSPRPAPARKISMTFADVLLACHLTAVRPCSPAWGPTGLGSRACARQHPGSRRCFLRSGFCAAVRKDLRVPWTREGPTRTMRGVPARSADLSPGDRRTRHAAWLPSSSRLAIQGALRRGPVAAGGGDAVRGSRRGHRPSSEGRGGSCRRATARPLQPRPLPSGQPSRTNRPRLLALGRWPWSWPSGLARRRCALETVQKVFTARRELFVLSRLMLYT
jgi:hypothetical protein